jgi:uncharacterized protein (DUF1330 family)
MRHRKGGVAMPAYAVGLYNMQDRSWLPAYQEKVTALIAKHGGRYIARASKCPWMVLEGKDYPITGITIIEFPSMEHAKAWHRDPEYAPFIKLRQAGSQLDLMLVEGCDG